MEKKNFWNEAAKYGVIMALVAILFDVLGFYVQNTLLSLLSLVIFVLLLVQLFSGMLASAIKGGFFGLFIAAFTKRDPDVFSEGTNQ